MEDFSCRRRPRHDLPENGERKYREKGDANVNRKRLEGREIEKEQICIRKSKGKRDEEERKKVRLNQKMKERTIERRKVLIHFNS